MLKIFGLLAVYIVYCDFLARVAPDITYLKPLNQLKTLSPLYRNDSSYLIEIRHIQTNSFTFEWKQKVTIWYLYVLNLKQNSESSTTDV